jgi:hypothetical protein
VLELRAVTLRIIGCFGKPPALDRLAEAEGGRSAPLLSIRVASDELLLLTDGQRLAGLETELHALDNGSLVLDVTSGYGAWALRGDGRAEAFCRLSAIKLPNPPSVVQGLVAHVPAKVVVSPDTLLILVPSILSHHLRERVLAACADLQPVEHESRVESDMSHVGSQSAARAVRETTSGAHNATRENQDSSQ